VKRTKRSPLLDRPRPTRRYKEQWGVIVICDGEAHQQRIYGALSALALRCKVVVT